MANYSVLLVAAIVVISLPVLTLFILAPIFRASRPNKVKLEPYECGIPASSLARTSAASLILVSSFKTPMNFDPTWIFLSLIPGGIGFVLFVYGKKLQRWPHMIAGLLLMDIFVVVALLTIGARRAAALGAGAHLRLSESPALRLRDHLQI